MEKLTISNFAGLKDAVFDVSPVTGLIGPQASGKSVTAKLLYFFREIASRLPAAVIDGMNAALYRADCCKRFARYFPFENAGVSDFNIEYTTRDQSVQVTFGMPDTGEASLALDWSEFYAEAIERFAAKRQELVNALGETDQDAVGEAQRNLRQEYDDEAAKVLGPWSKYEQIFIPAGRAFFSQVRASVFTRLEAGESIDPFMTAFGSLIERSKSVLESRGFFATPEFSSSEETRLFEWLHSAFEEILHAKLCRVEKQDFLQFGDGRRVRLAQASSGQQEALPLLILLARFLSLGHSRGRAVYIEEPEAHLFPSTQQQIVELMARAFRASKGQMCLVITTHSPYILTSINNLLQAGKLYATANAEAARRLQSIVPKNSSFNPGEVGFFELRDGSARSIIEPDTGLIEAATIDNVSTDIAMQFDKLLLEANEKS